MSFFSQCGMQDPEGGGLEGPGEAGRVGGGSIAHCCDRVLFMK